MKTWKWQENMHHEPYDFYIRAINPWLSILVDKEPCSDRFPVYCIFQYLIEHLMQVVSSG